MKRAAILLCAIGCATPSEVGTSRAGLSSPPSTWTFSSDDGSKVVRCAIEDKETADGGVDSGAADSGVGGADAGAGDGGVPPSVDAGVAMTWSLTTSPTHILNRDGTRFRGRGANLPDAHSCSKNLANSNWTEVQRRIGVAATTWKMNLIRLALENPSQSDEAYFNGLLATVRDARTKYPDLVLLVSVWIDPTLTNSSQDSNHHGAPTAATAPLWTRLATLLRDEPNVMFGIANEPRQLPDATVIAAYKPVVDAIRAAERPGQQHVVLVQGTSQWGRTAGPWVGNLPGPNVGVEIHVYDPASAHVAQLSHAVPLLIGEHGNGGMMSQADNLSLMKLAESRDIPYAVWIMHPACYNGGTAIIAPGEPALSASPMTPTAWGEAFKARLALPWGAP